MVARGLLRYAVTLVQARRKQNCIGRAKLPEHSPERWREARKVELSYCLGGHRKQSVKAKR